MNGERAARDEDEDARRARIDRVLGIVPEPEPDYGELAMSDPDDGDWLPPVPDRVEVAMWERAAADAMPLGPPYDLPEQLQRLARDAAYLRDAARADRRLAKLWHDRYMQQQAALRALVMAADRGSTLTRHLEAARRLLPPSIYKRPPR